MEYLIQLQKDKKLAKIINELLPVLQMRQNIPLRLMASQINPITKLLATRLKNAAASGSICNCFSRKRL